MPNFNTRLLRSLARALRFFHLDITYRDATSHSYFPGALPIFHATSYFYFALGGASSAAALASHEPKTFSENYRCAELMANSLGDCILGLRQQSRVCINHSSDYQLESLTACRTDVHPHLLCLSDKLRLGDHSIKSMSEKSHSI